MAVTNYVTLGGSVYSEIGATARLDYRTDALGSVTGTVASSGAVQNAYRYKPYGSILSQSGTGTAPKFQWAGTLGYRQTGLTQSEVYVRARHYGQLFGAWITVDQLWPIQRPYTYALGMAVSITDRSGLACSGGDKCCCKLSDFKVTIGHAGYVKIPGHPGAVGSHFEITANVTKSKTHGAGCSLQWWEKSSNVRREGYLKLDKWGTSSQAEADFNAQIRKIKCPGSGKVTMVDSPWFDPAEGSFSRNMCWKIIFHGCDKSSNKDFKFWQVIQFTAGTQSAGIDLDSVFDGISKYCQEGEPKS